MAATPNLDTIFCAAVALAAPEERAAYTASACADDGEVRERVQRLVEAHFRAGSFLGEPAAAGETGDFAAAPDAPPAPEGPGGVVGPYKLLQRIGEGGVGAVFLAEQTPPVQRRVALKLVKPGLDTRAVLARFEAERQALALMDHPNIARVLDAGATQTGRPYFVMELVRGVPITRYCDEHKRTPRERLGLFVPVCRAVQHAHSKGVIHRDLKPSNVLVALYDGAPVPKVIDFGIAKAAGQKLTDHTLFTERRYETAVGLARDVERYLADEPVLACPPSAAYRPRKFAGRHRGPVLAASLVLLALLGGVAGTTAGLVRAERARGAEAAQREQAERERDRKEEARRDAVANERKARDAAEAEKKAKEAEAAQRQQAEAVARLLESAFRGLDPAAAGADLKGELVRRLDDVAAGLEKEYAGEPLARARLRNALGMTRLGLGECDKAAALFRQALEEFRAHLGPDHRDTLHAMNNLAEAERRAGRLDGALPLLQEALEKMKAALGPDRAQTLTVAHNLARALPRHGPAPDALPLYERTLERLRAKFPPDHPLVLTTMHNLGVAYLNDNKLDKALPLLEEVRKMQGGRRGPGHPDVLANLVSLSTAYFKTGQPAKGVPPLEEAVRGFRARYGTGHPDTLRGIVSLARAYRDVSRDADALPLFEEAVKLTRAAAGDDFFRLTVDLASLYERRAADAEPLLRRATRLDPDAAPARSLLGLALSKQGKLTEAEAALRDAIAREPKAARAHTALGGVYARTGRWKEAAAAVGRGLELGPNEDWFWYEGAVLFLSTGDVGGYRRACRKMLELSGRTDKPETAVFTVLACTAAPDAVGDLGPVHKLADLAVAGTEDHPQRPLFLFAKGMADYRAGRPAEALERLKQCAPKAGGERATP